MNDLEKIAKLDPQPKYIFRTGYNDDGTWGAFEGIMVQREPTKAEDSPEMCRVLIEGNFIACPVEVTVGEWVRREIDFKKIDGKWWWVRCLRNR